MGPWLSPTTILNALAALEPHVIVRDIPYADGPRNGLDIYRPDATSTGLPVAVFFYGGGWEEGEKESYRFVGAALANRGIATVIPDYRVYPEVLFPTFLRDAALAVRWVHDHARDFGGDPGKVVLVGHSAGAHTAAMLTFDPQWLTAVGLDARGDIRGMAGIAGPYDFLPLHSETLKRIFGPPDQLPRTQPITFVDGKAPPAFLVTGRADTVVDPGNTSRLAERIRACGGVARTKVYARVGHPTIIGAFAPPLRPLAPVLSDTVAFIRHVTGGERQTAPEEGCAS